VNQTTAIKINYAPVLPACGNGLKEGAEQCDDGNQNNTDGCNNLCQATTTGGGG
jgi:cysteine-rich repeat protein